MPLPAVVIVPAVVVPSSHVILALKSLAGVVVPEKASVIVATVPLNAVPSVAVIDGAETLSPAAALNIAAGGGQRRVFVRGAGDRDAQGREPAREGVTTWIADRK